MKTLLKYPLFYCLLGIALAAFSDSVRRDFWWGIGVLGSLIMIYAWFVRQEKGGERIRAGDNCYFIGFVYTLSVIALAVGLDAGILLELREAGVSPETSAETGPRQLLETIGIAMATSVVGMILRFMLSHNAEIPEDEFDGVVSRAVLAANRLEGAVSAMAASAKYYKESMESAVITMKEYEKGLSVHVDTIGGEGKRIGERLDKVAEEVIAGFGGRLADMLQKNHFDAVRDDMEEAVSRYREAAVDMAHGLKESSAHLREFGAMATSDAKLANETLIAFQSSVAGMPDKIADAVTETMQVLQREISGRFSDISQIVEQSMGSLQTAMDSGKWTALEESASNFSTQLEKMNEGLRKIGEQQEEVLKTASGDIERLRSMRDNFAELMDDMKKDTEMASDIKAEYRRKFDEAAEAALTETHQLYGKLIGGASVALSQLDNLKTLGDSLEKIARQLEKNDK